MNKVTKKVATVFFISTFAIYANSNLEINLIETIKEINYYKNSIKNNSSNDIQNILNKYDCPEAKALKLWFKIVRENLNNPFVKNFINDTSYYINLILNKVYMNDSFSQNDFNITKEKVDYIYLFSKSLDSAVTRRDLYGVSAIELNLRNLPFATRDTNKVTRMKKLKNGEIVTLLYSISYTFNHHDYIWSYVETKNGFKGWVRKKYLEKIK